MEMNGVWRCENCGEVVEPVDGRARWAGDRWQHACGDPQAGHYDCRFFGEADAVVCKACGEALVSEPRLDWCVACDRKVCVGCIDHIDDESGMRFCVDCAAKEQPVDREADTTAIDAAHRRATDDDLPDEPSADDKLAEWDERMRSLSDDYCPAEHPYPPISTRRPREERR